MSWLRHLSGFTAWLSLSAALSATEVAVRAGPFLVWSAGSVQVAVIVVGPPATGAGLRLVPSHGEPGAPLVSDRFDGTSQVTWTLPIGSTSLTYTVEGAVGGARTGVIPAIPAKAALACVALAGEGAWPSRADLDRLGDVLEAPVQAVLVLSQREPRQLGRGGWEATLPIIVPGPSALPAPGWLGPAAGCWPRGLRWGALGLPCASDATQAGRSLGEFASVWPVLCLPAGPWDPSLVAAPAAFDPAVLTDLVRLGSGMQIPLMLGGGSLAGLLSEPLSIDEVGVLAVRPGGTRYLLVPGLGDGLAAVAPAVALPQDGTVFCGLRADDEALVLAWAAAPAAGGELRLEWVASGIEPTRPDGWGRGDAKTLRRVISEGLATGAPPTPAMADSGAALAALARSQLPLAEPTNEDWSRLVTLAESPDSPVPWARMLVRRLLATGDVRARFAPTLAGTPVWAQREVALRLMSDPHEVVATWLGTIATTSDVALVRAALVRAERSTLPVDLGVLVERLRRQAAGTVAVDADPVLQSRLTALIFDSPWLSPTPLRPIARDLLPRLSDLGAAPVKRFLERVGSERPANR